MVLGETLTSCVPIANEPLRLLEEVSKAGDDAEVVQSHRV
jgi:hypothetical protein